MPIALYRLMPPWTRRITPCAQPVEDLVHLLKSVQKMIKVTQVDSSHTPSAQTYPCEILLNLRLDDIRKGMVHDQSHHVSFKWSKRHRPAFDTVQGPRREIMDEPGAPFTANLMSSVRADFCSTSIKKLVPETALRRASTEKRILVTFDACTKSASLNAMMEGSIPTELHGGSRWWIRSRR